MTIKTFGDLFDEVKNKEFTSNYSVRIVTKETQKVYYGGLYRNSEGNIIIFSVDYNWKSKVFLKDEIVIPTVMKVTDKEHVNYQYILDADDPLVSEVSISYILSTKYYDDKNNNHFKFNERIIFEMIKKVKYFEIVSNFKNKVWFNLKCIPNELSFSVKDINKELFPFYIAGGGNLKRPLSDETKLAIINKFIAPMKEYCNTFNVKSITCDYGEDEHMDHTLIFEM